MGLPASRRPDGASTVAVVAAAIRRRAAGRAAPLLVGLDGGSGAGKSTLAAALVAELGATSIDGDDFFANDRPDAAWDVLSPAERAAACIDWRRLRAEALAPLLAGRAATWQPCDFARPGAGLAARTVTRRPAAVIVLDGIYSCRPELADLIDLSVLVEAPAALRRRRHDVREGGAEAAWHARWDPAEAYYFAHVRPATWFDLVVDTATGEVRWREADPAG